MKKIICMALVLVMLFSRTCVYAGLDTVPDTSSIASTFDTKASVKTWMKYGWKLIKNVLGNWVESQIELSEDTTDGSNYVQLVSPDIEYGADVLKAFRFKPEVDESVYSIRMYGHRVIAVDVFSKLGISLFEDSNNIPIWEDVVTTHEFSTYKPDGSEAFGDWVAEYSSTDSVKWQLFYVHYFDTARTVSSFTLTDDLSACFAPNNRVFFYSNDSETTSDTCTFSTQRELDMQSLNSQFTDDNGNYVDYLSDFSVGDSIFFSDTISAIEYDFKNNITSFIFSLNNDNIAWMFSGDYREDFSVGDKLSLRFNVVNVGEYRNHVFESIDYFEAAFTAPDTPPALSMYLQ